MASEQKFGEGKPDGDGSSDDEMSVSSADGAGQPKPAQPASPALALPSPPPPLAVPGGDAPALALPSPPAVPGGGAPALLPPPAANYGLPPTDYGYVPDVPAHPVQSPYRVGRTKKPKGPPECGMHLGMWVGDPVY
jgi:hypothetical protein